jgi:hypothetical protein
LNTCIARSSGEKTKVGDTCKKGIFKIVNPAETDADEITMHIVSRDRILAETDVRDIIYAVSAREKGDCYICENVCG